jgi:hypothetical protein
MTENRPVPVPQAQAEILGFQWRLFLAPGLQPAEPPLGLRFDRPTATISWAERLFGPLGRSAGQMRMAFARPEAWIAELVGSDPDSELWSPQDTARPPANWSSWNASAEEIPAEVSLKIWRSGSFRTLAWMVGLVCVIGSLALSRFAPRVGRRLGPVVFAASVALAIAAPAPYALLAGACVSGLLLAAVLPKLQTKARSPRAPQDEPSNRPGSTVSFELRAVGALVAVAATVGTAAFAQGPLIPPAEIQSAFPTTVRRAQLSPENDLQVVIPVHLNQLPIGIAAALPDDKQLVYVSPRALDALRLNAAEIRRNEGIVLLSSDYVISLDERQPATIEATYRVAVMPDSPRLLLLRLGPVTLAGASACRVDGRAFPIRKIDDGFALTLDANPGVAASDPITGFIAPGPTRRPIAAKRPSQTSRAGVGSGANVEKTFPHVYEIHLSFLPNGSAKPGQFEIEVPKTVRTTVRIGTGGPWKTAIVEAATGASRQLVPGQSAIDLGCTDRIRIKTAVPSAPETSDATIAANAVQLLRVSRRLVEMNCRVTYDCQNAIPQQITWLVPATASVRAISGTYRAALRPRKPAHESDLDAKGKSASARRSSVTVEDLVPLDFDCSSAPAGPLTLAATLLVPVDAKQDRAGLSSLSVRLPRFDRVNTGEAGIVVASNQVGVSAIPGYRVIIDTTEPSLPRAAKTDPTFPQESFGTRRDPERIFDCRGISELPLQLAAIVPTHKVRLMSHEARVSADRIQWRTTAEIRTENAPAFMQALHVDRRLKIDSISVREDDVERLVRYSQSGDEVTLFLRDRAAATQDLTLTGHLSLEAGRPTKLPSVRLMHGVVSDDRLTISHDADVDIAVSDSPGVVRINGGGASTANVRSPATSDVIQCSLAVDAVMPEIRVTRRVEAAQATRTTGAAPKTGPQAPGSPSRSTQLVATTQPAVDQKPRVEVLAILQLRRDQAVIGATHVLLERFPEPSLRLSWPESTILRGALVDGRPVQPTEGRGWISSVVPSESTPHRISLYWERRSGTSLSALGRVNEELPAPVEGTAKSVLLSVTVPTGFKLLAPARFEPLDRQTFAGLRGTIQSTNTKSVGDEALGLFKGAAATPEAALIGRLSVGPTNATLSAWTVDVFWLRLSLAVATFVLIALAGAHSYAARTAAWLLDRPALTLATVGVIWWFCLAPRAIGPLSLIIAFVMLILDRRRRDGSRSRALPSTLHAPAGVEGR